MNLRRVLFVMFVILCTMSVVVASDMMTHNQLDVVNNNNDSVVVSSNNNSTVVNGNDDFTDGSKGSSAVINANNDSSTVCSNDDSVDDSNDDHGHSGVIHSHHRPSYMNKFSQNHPDYNVLNAMIEVADSGII